MDNYRFNNECNIRSYNTADYARGLLIDEELKLNKILVLPTVYSLLENLIKNKINCGRELLLGFYPNTVVESDEDEFYYQEFEVKIDKIEQSLLSEIGYDLYKITGYNPIKRSEFMIILNVISEDIYNMNKRMCEEDDCRTLEIPIILYENTFDDTDNLQGFEDFIFQKLISFTTRQKIGDQNIIDDRVEYAKSFDRKLFGKIINQPTQVQFFEFNIGIYDKNIIKETYGRDIGDKIMVINEYYGSTRKEDKENKMKPFSIIVSYIDK